MNQFYLKAIHRSNNGEIESQSCSIDDDEIIIGMKHFPDIKLTVRQLVALAINYKEPHNAK